MLSNVYTKQEILDTLAQKGYFIDAYTLDSFFEQWKVEAIYEDEEGKEFFDKDTLNLILNNLFESPKKEEDKQEEENEMETVEQEQDQPDKEQSEETLEAQETSLDEPLEEKPEFETIGEQEPQKEEESQIKEEEQAQTQVPQQDEELQFSEYEPQEQNAESQEQQEDFDDISLISESFEAQQKFREYVVSQLAKSNGDLAPGRNEFKLDISERTLNMIARTLAKKITKYVGAICVADAKVAAKLEEAEEKNKGLEQKVQMLEEQNKKLRMLLTESNKNLNSYKPGFFGLYIKVPSKK